MGSSMTVRALAGCHCTCALINWSVLRHEGCLGSLFIVRPDPRCSIINVSREDSLGTVDHEEWCIAGGPAGGHPQASEHRRKLCNASFAKLVQPVEDPRLEC